MLFISYVTVFFLFEKQLQDVALCESSPDDILSDDEPDLEENSVTDDLLDYPRDETTDEDDHDPEWSSLEDKAEDQESGDDEENDTSESRNTVR